MEKTNRQKMIEWKTETEISIEEWEAMKIKSRTDFSPWNMGNYLVKAKDGTVYVDRSKMVRSKEQEQEFYYMLKEEYISVWRDIENLTPYFEIKDLANDEETEIIAGA